MLKSLRLGKFFGIDVYLHSTFWLLPGFVLVGGLMSRMPGDELLRNLLLVFAISVCILLHEFGHAFAARACGVRVRHITMYPLLGLASLEGMPARPMRELAIVLAGPAVNLVLAGVFGGLLLVLALANPSIDRDSAAYAFVYWLALANLLLCAFNLLPGFPLDGGHALRAILCLRLDRLRATTITAGVGAVVAGICLVFGFLLPEPGLILLAIIVFLMGHVELTLLRAREFGRDLRDWLSDFFASRGRREPEPGPGPAPLPSPPPAPDGPPAPGFSGLAWDASRRVWVEWKNGVRMKKKDEG